MIYFVCVYRNQYFYRMIESLVNSGLFGKLVTEFINSNSVNTNILDVGNCHEGYFSFHFSYKNVDR